MYSGGFHRKEVEIKWHAEPEAKDNPTAAAYFICFMMKLLPMPLSRSSRIYRRELFPAIPERPRLSTHAFQHGGARDQLQT
jgi:hypothetical protein